MGESGVNFLIQRGQRRAQELRPATLIYSQGNANAKIPCTPGNLDFFERLGEGGFAVIRNMHVTMLRENIPPAVQFHKGDPVVVRDDVTGKEYQLEVGDGNSEQTMVMILNLTRPPA